MAEHQLSKGDKVEWKSHRHNVEGTVEQKITDDTDAAGRRARASADDPQ